MSSSVRFLLSACEDSRRFDPCFFSPPKPPAREDYPQAYIIPALHHYNTTWAMLMDMQHVDLCNHVELSYYLKNNESNWGL